MTVATRFEIDRDIYKSAVARGVWESIATSTVSSTARVAAITDRLDACPLASTAVTRIKLSIFPALLPVARPLGQFDEPERQPHGHDYRNDWMDSHHDILQDSSHFQKTEVLHAYL